MNRYTNNTHNSLEKKINVLYVAMAVGATGAPTLDAPASKGIASVVRNSVGRYTITLQDKYVALKSLLIDRVLASGTPGAGSYVLRSVAVSAATPVVVIEFVDAAGAAAELTSGVSLLMKLELKATSV